MYAGHFKYQATFYDKDGYGVVWLGRNDLTVYAKRVQQVLATLKGDISKIESEILGITYTKEIACS